MTRAPAGRIFSPFHPPAEWALRLPAVALLAMAPLVAPEPEPLLATALAAAGAAAALALVHPRAGAAGRRGMQLAALAGLPLAVSLWNAVDPGAARTRLVEFALAVVAFRAARDLLGANRRATVATLLAVVGGVTGAHGLYQRAFGFPRALEALPGLGLPEAATYAERLATGRVFSTFLLPSTFAGFLLLSLPATAWLLSRGRGAARVALAASAAVQVGALFLTYSHGAWTALAVALLLVGATAPSPALRRAALAAAVAAAILLAAVVALRAERLSGPDREHNPLAERLGNWEVATRQIADHPATGVGWGGYGPAYTPYQEAGMNQSRYAHNSYLQIAAEGGLMTVPFVALLLASVAGRLVRSRAGNWAFDLALVATLLHNVVDFTLFRPAVAVPFFGLLGAVAIRPPDGASAPRLGRVAALALAVAIPAAAIPAALAATWAAAGRAALVEGRPEESRERMRGAVRLDPWTAEYRDFLARWWLDHGRDGAEAGEARRQAEAACRLAPLTPHHRTTLELCCLAQGDLGCAYRSAARAASLFPASGEYRARLEEIAAALEVP